MKLLNPDMVQDVLDFHDKFHQYVGLEPHWPPFNVVRMRLRLVAEEYDELNVALAKENPAEIADAVGDLMYVLIGMMNAFGIDMRPIWAAIHRANMAKVGGDVREDGKILKPEGWQPANIAQILDLQGPDWFICKYRALSPEGQQEETPTDG